MSDYRKELLSAIEQSIATVLDHDACETVTRKILCILNDYEVTKRTTEVAVYDDINERLLKRYCACLLIDGKAQSTIYAYSRNLQRFSEFIGKRFTEIGPYDIRYYLASEKERGVSEVTLDNTRASLSAFFGWMAAEEIIPKSPCMIIKPIKCPKKEKKAFTAIEMDALRHSCVTPRERAIIEVLASTGVRVSELEHMNVDDVDFDRLTVHVRNGKGGKDRTTYINDVAKMHIQMYLAMRNEDGEALIYNEKHQRLQDGGVRDILKRIGKRAGVTNVHPHRFRRTLATNLAARGMALQEIQRILGHSDINTTMRYVCINDRNVQASYQQHIA